MRIYRQLTRTKPDGLLADTGAALLNLSSWLAASGEDDEALAPAVEAVAVFRLLTKENQDAHLPDLAMALNNAAVRLADQDREEEALTAAEEAASIFGSLADGKPDAYLPDLAMALNNLAVRLGHCGRAEDALAPAERAMRICRSLAETSPGAYLADLALCLNNLATTSAAVGNRGEALVHWLEVARLEVGIRERSRALRHLFAIPVAERPKEFDAVLVEALASVVRTAMAELVQVGTVRDRRSLADETAWLVSAGAVFLAHEIGRRAQAIEWLDALLGMEARMVGAIHDSDFDRLQREHPTLATRLQNALTRFNPAPLGHLNAVRMTANVAGCFPRPSARCSTRFGPCQHLSTSWRRARLARSGPACVAERLPGWCLPPAAAQLSPSTKMVPPEPIGSRRHPTTFSICSAPRSSSSQRMRRSRPSAHSQPSTSSASWDRLRRVRRSQS